MTMADLWLLSCFALLGVSSGHGEPASLPELRIRPRIVNGDEALPGEWPWHVALLSQRGSILCGGALINHNWVLSVAHCNFTRAHRVVLGMDDRRSPGFIQELRIARVFRHPMFSRTTQHSDIALLRLRSGAHFNSKVSPLRLPRADDQFLPGSWCKISGWGFTDVNGTKRPHKLQEASVTIVDDSRCHWIYPHLPHHLIFCAGRRGVGSHHGDSGGSLVCLKNGVWTLAGIMSTSHEPSFIKLPFVATRVPAYIPWIEHILAHN